MPAILDFPCFVFLEKSLVIVELSLLCSQGHCHTVKIIVVIFLHLFWAQVLRLCHGLGIGSCQNICLSRQLASPNTFIYFNGRRTFPPQMSRMYIVGCQLSQRELQNMQSPWHFLSHFHLAYSQPIYYHKICPKYLCSPAF